MKNPKMFVESHTRMLEQQIFFKPTRDPKLRPSTIDIIGFADHPHTTVCLSQKAKHHHGQQTNLDQEKIRLY